MLHPEDAFNNKAFINSNYRKINLIKKEEVPNTILLIYEDYLYQKKPKINKLMRPRHLWNKDANSFKVDTTWRGVVHQMEMNYFVPRDPESYEPLAKSPFDIEYPIEKKNRDESKLPWAEPPVTENDEAILKNMSNGKLKTKSKNPFENIIMSVFEEEDSQNKSNVPDMNQTSISWGESKKIIKKPLKPITKKPLPKVASLTSVNTYHLGKKNHKHSHPHHHESGNLPHNLVCPFHNNPQKKVPVPRFPHAKLLPLQNQKSENVEGESPSKRENKFADKDKSKSKSKDFVIKTSSSKDQGDGHRASLMFEHPNRRKSWSMKQKPWKETNHLKKRNIKKEEPPPPKPKEMNDVFFDVTKEKKNKSNYLNTTNYSSHSNQDLADEATIQKNAKVTKKLSDLLKEISAPDSTNKNAMKDFVNHLKLNNSFFKEITNSTALELLRTCEILIFENEFIYKRGDMSEQAYLILYGKVALHTKETGIFLECLMGDTLNEDNILLENLVARQETCKAIDETALLEFSKNKIKQLKETLKESQNKNDYLQLISTLQKQFYQKKYIRGTQQSRVPLDQIVFFQAQEIQSSFVVSG